MPSLPECFPTVWECTGNEGTMKTRAASRSRRLAASDLIALGALLGAPPLKGILRAVHTIYGHYFTLFTILCADVMCISHFYVRASCNTVRRTR